MKFIELTLSKNKKPTYINVANIAYFNTYSSEYDSNANATIIMTGIEIVVHVIENCDEILKKIAEVESTIVV